MLKFHLFSRYLFYKIKLLSFLCILELKIAFYLWTSRLKDDNFSLLILLLASNCYRQCDLLVIVNWIEQHFSGQTSLLHEHKIKIWWTVGTAILDILALHACVTRWFHMHSSKFFFFCAQNICQKSEYFERKKKKRVWKAG